MTLFDYLNFLAVAECRSITTAAGTAPPDKVRRES